MGRLRQAAPRILGLLVMVAGVGCAETPIWTSDPVPLLRAIADGDARLVAEWADGGRDLDRPRPLSESGLSALGAWRGGTSVRPIDLAVALERPALAWRLVEGGAAIGPAAAPLACLTVFRGVPADLDRLRARALPVDPAFTCETPETGTLGALARRNGEAMSAALVAAAEPR